MRPMPPISCLTCPSTLTLEGEWPKTVAIAIERAALAGWRVLLADSIGCGTCPDCLAGGSRDTRARA